MNSAVGFATAVISLDAGFRSLTEKLVGAALFFPDRYPSGAWDFSRLPLRPSEHVIRTPDGLRLHAIHFAAAEPIATIIWFHGNAGNISTRADLAAQFASRGVSVFLFDYRGYGRSEGTPTERGARIDSLAAYDCVRGTLTDDPQSIVLYGESIGGPFAAYVASRKPARCVVIESSFPSLSAMAAVHYPFTPFRFFVRKSLRTLEWLNRARLPVLVMHGTADDIVPLQLGMQLYGGLEVSKQLLCSEGAAHCEIPYWEGERYYSTIISFIRSSVESRQGV